MKTIRKLFLTITSLAILFAGQNQAMEKPNNHFLNYIKTASNQELLEKYSVSPELKNALDKAQFISWKNCHELTCISHDGKDKSYIKKYDPLLPAQSRLPGSLLIRKCAEENGLNVSSPIKLLYEKDGQRYIIAEAITPISDPFSLKQIQHIYITCKKTNYRDIATIGNILNTKDGIVYFVDTEPRSFGLRNSSQILLEIITRLELNDDATQWVTEKIDKKYLKAHAKS